MYCRWLAVLAGLLLPIPVQALGPQDVFLIVNKKVPESRTLAEHYCQQRDVPKDHIVELALPTTEDISRQDFNKSLREPLRAAFQEKRDRARVLVSMYGVPLRVSGGQPSEEEKKILDKVRAELKETRAKQKQIEDEVKKREEEQKQQSTEEGKKQLEELRQKRDRLNLEIQGQTHRERWLNHAESVAAVDSELMLLWWDEYELRRWQVNLLNWRIPDKLRQGQPPIVLVSRLDGPSPAIVQRLIDDAVEVEKKGLTGKVYVDARGIKYQGDRDAFGYGGYDQSLRDMAELLDKQGKMTVVLDDKGELFTPQTCTEAALYCGWYSHARYVDCCKFARGAVAYHIASSEAVSLRNPKATYWCPRLLQDGVVATLGPVSEPYTIGFPKPAEFFGFLVTGEDTLVECYGKTLQLNSWMTVLVGDPLYNPYKNASRLRSEQVQPSPANSPLLLDRPRKRSN
jgi:uncharacterized protein (TIGR03790 family)